MVLDDAGAVAASVGSVGAMSTQCKLAESIGTSRDILARFRGLAVPAGVRLRASETEIRSEYGKRQRIRGVLAIVRYTNATSLLDRLMVNQCATLK